VSDQPVGHADGNAQDTQICTRQSATLANNTVDHIGGSVRVLPEVLGDSAWCRLPMPVVNSV
jgi:hypothetical protein